MPIYVIYHMSYTHCGESLLKDHCGYLTFDFILLIYRILKMFGKVINKHSQIKKIRDCGKSLYNYIHTSPERQILLNTLPRNIYRALTNFSNIISILILRSPFSHELTFENVLHGMKFCNFTSCLMSHVSLKS